MVRFSKMGFGFGYKCISDVTITMVQGVVSSGRKSHKLIEFWDVFLEITVVKILQDNESSIRIHVLMHLDHAVHLVQPLQFSG